jgi:hypothetical protein
VFHTTTNSSTLNYLLDNRNGLPLVDFDKRGRGCKICIHWRGGYRNRAMDIGPHVDDLISVLIVYDTQQGYLEREGATGLPGERRSKTELVTSTSMRLLWGRLYPC